jgi:hypothetical protein
VKSSRRVNRIAEARFTTTVRPTTSLNSIVVSWDIIVDAVISANILLEQEVDSTLAGNKIRFINNADADENRNCYPRQSLTDGVIRLGLYARRDLIPGEELFFHYGWVKIVFELYTLTMHQ